MTAEIINLNRIRKLRERQAREASAAQNRVWFGRTREERERLDTEEAQRRGRLDGHERVQGDEALQPSVSADGAAQPSDACDADPDTGLDPGAVS